MAREMMTQKPKTRMTSWFIILALIFSIPGCGGGTGEDQQAKGGLGEPVIAGPPDPGAPSYSVTLAWDTVTKNVDGTDCFDLAGYKVYYGTTSGVFTNESALITETTFTTPLLPQGTYYFAVKAFDIDGNSSEYSSPTYGLCVNVDATPAPCPW